jgi:hypothetical protein
LFIPDPGSRSLLFTHPGSKGSSSATLLTVLFYQGLKKFQKKLVLKFFCFSEAQEDVQEPEQQRKETSYHSYLEADR